MTQHVQRKHARLSASRAERFMTCPGSYRLEEVMPYEPSGEAAAMGTKLHELSEKILMGQEIDDPDLDPEHLQLAQSYANFVNTLVESPRKRMIEVNVDAGLKSLHYALGGTADAVLVDGDHLHVIDAKFGRVLVDAEDNKQLLTYALGVMRMLNAPATITCTMHIYQPRAGHSKWTVTGADLIKHGEELLAAANLALTFDAPTNPSTSACKYCKAKPICPSIRAKVQDNARKDFIEIIKKDEKEGTGNVPAITPEMVELAQLAGMWSETVIELAKKQITSGLLIKGWVLRAGRKTKFWKSDALAYEALKSYPQAFDMKSPSAIAKLDIEISADLVGEKHAAASLVKEKSKD